MRRTFTVAPVIPRGYTGRNFNSWQKYLQAQIEKIYGRKPPQYMMGIDPVNNEKGNFVVDEKGIILWEKTEDGRWLMITKP